MAKKKVRVIATWSIQGLEYRPNQVVELDELLAKQGIKDGYADGSKEALRYCLDELGVEVVVHEGAGELAEGSSEPEQSADQGDLQV